MTGGSDRTGGGGPRRTPPPRRKAAAPPRPAARKQGTAPRVGRALRSQAPPDPRRPGPKAAARPLRLGSPGRRLRIGILVLAFVFSMYGGRLIQLQVLDGPGYGLTAAEARTSDYTLTATRGSILDDAGQPLAESVAAVDVTADPQQIKQLGQDPAVYAAKLAALLGNPPGTANVAQLQTQLSDSATQYQLLAKQITPQAWAKIQALGLSGVFGTPDPVTVYPQGPLASNVVGFVNDSGQGAEGLEEEYNSMLAGHNGQISYQAADGTEIPTAGINEQEPVNGTSVETTIDPGIEWSAQQAIDQEVTASGAASGTVVVEDPRTGAILALATAPSYDQTDLAAAGSANIGDRAVSDVYEPGSVAKVMTMSAAIQLGVATPATHVVVPPVLTPPNGPPVHDDTDHGTEDLTLDGILAQSSNIGTDEVTEQFGPNRNQLLYDYFSKFGIGRPTGLGLPGESPGIFPPPSQWNSLEIGYRIPFGQSVSLNAVQATSVFSTIADNGVRVTPTLVKGYVSPSGRFTSASAPARTQVISQQTANQVEQMMESVVSADGTAPLAEIPGYRVAGKTGTANRYDTQCGGYCGYTGSFIGFAPADNPRLVVSVVVQDPTIGNYAGGSVAAPVFKTVMSFALQSLGIAPTGTQPPSLPETW